MPNRISFALAIHNHQPVGNFGWVLAEVFDLAYAPLVNALERSPSVRVSLHYTGPLLEWLRAERPAFVERLRDLVVQRPGRDPRGRLGGTGPRLAPRARPGRAAHADGRRAGGAVRAPAARGVAGRARLGAVAAHVAP